MGMFSSSRTFRTPTWAMPRAKPPPRARPIPTLLCPEPRPEGCPERPRPNACTDRIILSRLFTGTSHHPGFCPANYLNPGLLHSAHYPEPNQQVRCQFSINRFMPRLTAPDYGHWVTRGYRPVAVDD